MDLVYSFLHFLVIVINLFGWIWKRTRRLHLFVFGITGVSWLLLGIKYGLGYCFLTDWQWHVKRQLGETNLPNSFIQYWVEKAGWNIDPETTDIATGSIFILLIIITAYIHIRPSSKQKITA